MKKNVLLVLFSIFTISSITAQLKPSLGIKGGLNFSNYEAGDDLDFESNTGFHVGLVLHIPLNEKFGIQPEAFYSTEGTKQIQDIGDIEIDLDYLTTPILLTYKVLPGLRVQAGPQFRVKVRADVDVEEGSSFSLDESQYEDDFNDLNFDAIVGLEYKFPILGLFVQARYN